MTQFDLEDPFLFCFFSLDQSNHSSDGHCQENYHFVFYPFHNCSFDDGKSPPVTKTMIISQKLYQTLKKTYPFSSIFLRPLSCAEL